MFCENRELPRERVPVPESISLFPAKRGCSWEGCHSNMFLGMKSSVLVLPLLLSSMVFNFTNIILGIINNNFFILFYLLAAFISVLLPATFSPADSINKLEKVLGLGLDQEKLKENTK